MSEQIATLREIVDRTALMAKTKRLDISFNELMDMYQADVPELEISPEFQRVFVWSEKQQSQFIESLLLELPIPPIYVIEDGDEGHYLLIDGLQRLSSYLHFRGALKNDHKGINPGDFLELEGCDIVEDLNRKTWNTLDTALQIRLKRAFVSLQIIRKESLPDLKYHMFKRLNSGGSEISPQQTRNAYVRMLHEGNRIMDFAQELANLEGFKLTCYSALTEKHQDRQSDAGYVLRFLGFKNAIQKYVHDVDSFIDEYVESIARGKDHALGTDFDYENEKDNFQKTFDILAASTGEFSFTFPNRARTDLTAGFSVYHFEGVTLGIQSSLGVLDKNDATQMNILKNTLRDVRLGEDFREVSSGGGKNTRGLLERRIAIIEGAVKAQFQS